MKNLFQFIYKVKKEDIDDLQHVNNLKYIEWALGAAQKHWEHMSGSDIRKKYVWVVARHEIDYFKPAFEEDKVKIKTWIDSLHKASSIRIVEMYKDDQLIARVKTNWVLLDAITHRITRIPPSFEQFVYSEN
jgi:acyl-CoA thioester hydrolase